MVIKYAKDTELSALQASIVAIEIQIRNRYPWLKYQNIIGVTIFGVAASNVILSSLAYLYGYIPGWLCIILNAFFVSFLHELEHDIFHNQYFSNRKLIQNTLLFCCWLFKPNTINPWIRKKIHLHHHRYSGTAEDIEEQLIGNGMRYGWRRFLVMSDPIFALVQFPILSKNSKTFRPWLMLLSGFPFVYLFDLTLFLWLYLHIGSLLQLQFDTNIWLVTTLSVYLPILNNIMIIVIAPSMLRVFCLQFISSSMHYFLNVKSLIEQTQVLNHWIFLPFQLFCVNFGATHGIHHIRVQQPFYLRHFIRKACYPFMQAHGIRFNDFSTFRQGNQRQD